MSGDVIPREQAFAEARRALDAARFRRDLKRAAGRLAPEAEAICRRLERQQRTTRPGSEQRAAA